METNLDLLPALCGLYELAFTDEQLQAVDEQLDTFIASLNGEHRKEAERIRYVARAGTIVIEVVPYVARASTYKVRFKKYDSDEEALNAILPDGEHGFLIRLADREPIFIKNLTQGFFDGYTQWFWFFHNIANIEGLAPDFADNELNNAKTHILDFVKTHWLEYNDGPAVLTTREYKIDNIREQISKFLGDGATHQSVSTTSYAQNLISKFQSSLNIITDVWELDNYRFFLSMSGASNQYYYQRTLVYALCLRIIPHTNAYYDYVDVDRIFSTEKSTDFTMTESMPFATAIFTEERPTIPATGVMVSYLGRLSGETPALLDTLALKTIVNRHQQRIMREKAQEDAKTKLRSKAKQKISELQEEGSTLKINDLVVTKDTITYQKQKLALTAENDTDFWVQRVLQHAAAGWNWADLNFDQVYDAFLQEISCRNKAKGKIGDVSFDVKTKSSKGPSGVTSSRKYINGHRVNKDEVEQCLQQALCYETQEDYDKFLQSVSKCSLKVHRYLQLGLDLSVYDAFNHVNLTMKLPLERRNGHNYIVLGKNEYRIHDTNALLRLENKSDLLNIINVLLNPKIVSGVAIQNMKAIVKSAKKAHEDAIMRSTRLLEDAENMFNLRKQRIRMGNGSYIFGYRITGKLKEYALEIDEHDPAKGRVSVYDYDSGTYICIVDKSRSQVGMDKIVNRIYALANDSLVASQITTLQP